MNRPAGLIAFAGLAVAAIAYAGTPDKLPDAVNYRGRGGKPVWASRTVLDANTTSIPIRQSVLNSYPACFAWNTRVWVLSNASATCCFTLSSSVTLGSQTTFAATEVIDPTGGLYDYGVCTSLEAATPTEMIPDYTALQRNSVPGFRSGICTSVQGGANDILRSSPPCGVDADCTKAGASSTCDTFYSGGLVSKRRDGGCAFMVCKGTAANQRLTVMVER